MDKPADKSAATDAQARLRRAYQRKLGRKPTTLERSLIERLAKAEAATLDPATSVADCYRLESIVRKLRAEFDGLVAKPAPTKAGPDSLKAYASKYAVPA